MSKDAASVSQLTSAEPAAKDMKFRDVQFRKDGTMIIIPDGMTYGEAIVWLKRQVENEEKIVAINSTIPCFPLDGVVALAKAITRIYGHTTLTDTPTFFGPKPPTMVQVQTPKGLITAPVGRIQPAMYEGGFFSCMPGEMALIITGEVKRKFETEVKKVIDLTHHILKTESIYRGQAIVLDLSYIEQEREFHVVKDAPTFMSVDNVDEAGVILNEETLQEISAVVYGRLEQSEAYERNGIPLKHTALFAGKFGTGKTLTSKIIASKAVRNGWTFIYLETVGQIALALRMAEMYGPAVLFAEDIDLVTSGERDKDMNKILNTLDGVDTKDQPIITILTTNKEEKIEKAMMRAGRVDSLIRFGYPDAASAVRFVKMYAKDDDGKDLLAPMGKEGEDQVGEALAGKIPAFIAEAVRKAKCYAVAVHGNDIVGKVSVESIIRAASAQKAQLELLEGSTTMSIEEQSHEALRHIGHVSLDLRKKMTDQVSCRNGSN